MKRPKIYIKNSTHQREIEDKLEKGIIDMGSNSIYSTGMRLQNKLIDEQKLVQMMGKEPNRENYQELIIKLKDNPKLLFEIIPTSTNSKFKERIKKSNHTLKRNLLAKQKVKRDKFENLKKVRPRTRGTYIPLRNYSRENMDLISNSKKPSSLATHYSQKAGSVMYPCSNKSYKTQSEIIEQSA